MRVCVRVMADIPQEGNKRPKKMKGVVYVLVWKEKREPG